MNPQNRAPIYEALTKHLANRPVAFDVPGHKGGKGNAELTEFLGEKALRADVNSRIAIDNLCHPISVIKEAQELAAEAFGASSAFFMVNGTTSSVQAMIMSAVKAGEKIILPRNVHRSVMGALVICGAIPVYINPKINKNLGIPLGMSISDIRRAMDENPDAKAILVNNPTYYGICSALSNIVELAHERGMLALVDEAHGTHFYFGENLPQSAMSARADMASVSMHKTGTSLTQSSMLLCSSAVNAGYVSQIINLTQTTSASYLLLSSLDLARKNLSKNGREMFAKTLKLANYARDEINKIGGFYAFGAELIDGDSVFDFDLTKLSVHTRDVGLAGIEVYDYLREEYGIQIEFGDIGNILAIISGGDRELELERLLSSLAEVKRLYSRDKSGMFEVEYISPEVAMPPQQAFYAEMRKIPLGESAGEVAGEFVMCYPPGIPILAPGERITREILDYIRYAKEKGCQLTGTEDLTVEWIKVVG